MPSLLYLPHLRICAPLHPHFWNPQSNVTLAASANATCPDFVAWLRPQNQVHLRPARSKVRRHHSSSLFRGVQRSLLRRSQCRADVDALCLHHLLFAVSPIRCFGHDVYLSLHSCLFVSCGGRHLYYNHQRGGAHYSRNTALCTATARQHANCHRLLEQRKGS